MTGSPFTFRDNRYAAAPLPERCLNAARRRDLPRHADREDDHRQGQGDQGLAKIHPENAKITEWKARKPTRDVNPIPGKTPSQDPVDDPAAD